MRAAERRGQCVCVYVCGRARSQPLTEEGKERGGERRKEGGRQAGSEESHGGTSAPAGRMSENSPDASWCVFMSVVFKLLQHKNN